MSLGASRDRGEILLSSGGACLQLYVVAKDQITPCKQGVSAAGMISSDARGTLFLMGPILLDTTFSRPRLLIVPHFNSPVSQLTTDGGTAYFATGMFGGAGSGFASVRTSDGAVLDRQSLPIVPEVMLLLPDGSAMVTHGRVCYSINVTSSGCYALRDIYVTSLR
jgi:hypothetical protein